jgi:2-polyprenyl-6-methoxyphenol hydroxylase-like FAD-dependent oxidoreductase
MERPSVLISGMGIAGPALAWWLLRAGFPVTLVEHAPALRRGGYIIDFWGLGYDITEKMGLLPAVLEAGYRVRELRFVDGRGRRSGGFDADVFRRATLGRYTSLARSDLSAILSAAIAGRAEVVFGDHITALTPTATGVAVDFAHGPSRRFGLVVGADGLHSAVRALAFGPQADCERFLGYLVAAWEIAGYRPREADVYITYGVPGRQAARFALRGDRTLVMFVLAEEDGAAALPQGTEAQREYLRHRCAGMQWECPQFLEALDAAPELYFDRVSQIRLERWTAGRVALVGDAAYAPSLLAGQGSALALVGAYVLAGELSGAADPAAAFANYAALLQPFMLHKQRAAERFAGSFAPRSWLGIYLRSALTRLCGVPWIARLALGSSLLDRLELPDYG